MGDDGIEKGFLAELEALEKLRISYTAQYPSVPLAHDDPDVRRLIEAMAFFTARTRRAATRGLDESVQRVFRQQFPTLLSPVPAMAMLRATPGPTFADAAEIPRGSEVLLRRPAGDDGEPERLFRFRTTADLRILPLRVVRVDLVNVRGRGQRILLRLAASTSHNQELRELTLHINHLDDLRSSMTVAHELSTNLRSASVLYDPNAREDEAGHDVQITFGAPSAAGSLPDSFEDPLQRARMLARFPRQELFMNVRGLRPPRNWQHITLCLDVGEGWPRKLRLTSDGFELHAVPMVNVRRDLANPIEHDGTKDRYPLRHPDEAGKFVPLWAIGAYRPTKEGFVPVEPGVLGAEGDSYETMTEGQGEDRRAFAMFRMAGAFERPQLVSVDAFWHQPSLRGVPANELKVGLADRFVDGVTWACSGPIVPHADAVLDGDRDAQLALVSLKTMRFLGHAELHLLLTACGARDEPHFARLVAAMTGVRVSAKPFGKRTQGLKHVYELTFGALDTSDLPRLAMFCDWLLDLLLAWSADDVLEVVAHVPNLDRTVRSAA